MDCRFILRVRQILLSLIVMGCVAAVQAGDPPSGQGYIIIGQDWNQPTRCSENNADSLAISEAKVGSTVWAAVQSSGYYNWGYFGSSMTAPTETFYSDFPTMRRWYSFDVGASQSAEDRAPYCPPNENYDYWVGSYSLTTPNDNNVDTHYAPNHVYAFKGRSLTVSGSIIHCSKGTSICDFGTNVTLKSGEYGFPALGTHTQPVVRMKAKVDGTFGFVASSGMGNNQKACFVDVALTGAADKTVLFKQDSTYSATWYWCGDCSDYKGKLLVSGTGASPSCFTILAVSNVVCGGTVEVEAVQRLQMFGANAFVENVNIKPNAFFDVSSGQAPRVGTLNLEGELRLNAGAGLVTVTNAITLSATASISLDAGVSGAVLTVPADASLTAEQFVAAIARGGRSVTAVRCVVAGETKTFYVDNPTAVANKTLSVTESAVIDGADAQVRVEVAERASLNLTGSLSERMAIYNSNGTINIKRRLDDWQTIPTLWLDASQELTVSNVVVVYEDSYPDYEHSGKTLKMNAAVGDEDGNPFILGWFDRRGLASVKMWNNRYDNPFQGTHNVMSGTHPRRVKCGLNGMDYIAFDRPLVKTKFVYGDDTFNSKLSQAGVLSRIFFTTADAAPTDGGNAYVKPRYAFFVYGSAGGGGGALLGGNSSFLRGGTSAAHTKDDPIFANNTKGAKVWLDGTEVDPTMTGFNGAWQVVTVDYRDTSNAFYGLGYGTNDSNDNGGQAYAEVILVDVELSDRQRQTIEIYLAEKWGLKSQYDYPDWAKAPLATVYGTGTVNLETDAKLGGAFAGTIDLGGKNLTIDGTNLPPTAAAINTANLEGWYDPDAAGKTTEQNVTVTAEYQDASKGIFKQEKLPNPRMILLKDQLRAPTTGSFHIYGQPQRAPWLNDAKRGFGPVRKWMDFSNLMSALTPEERDQLKGLSNGNVLRFSKFNANGSSDGNTYQQPMQTLFFVQDSVHGGGHPFADGANVNAPVLYKSRTQTSAAVGQPIYPAGSNGVLTKGLTCLDGREVDGLTESFGARPEVVTVVPTNTFNLVAFGQLGNSENIQGGTTELIGEIMIYNRKLYESERRVVEAYLSHKWLGIEGAGYSALTDATVTGAGTVTAASAALLPKFGAGFTGTVTVPLTDGLDFTLATAGGTTSVEGAHDFGGGTLVASGDVTVRVAVDGSRPKSGSYKLLGWATKPSATWNLIKAGWDRDACTLRAADDGLYLDLEKIGLTVIVR